MSERTDKKSFSIDGKIFWPITVVMVVVAAVCMIFPDAFINFSNNTLGLVLDNFSWFILAMSFIVTVVLIYVACTPFGSKIVGGPNAEKVYKSDFTWFSVILCASIGIAIIFWAVYEPLGLFCELPAFAVQMGIEPGSNAAALFAIAETTWHWCGPYYGVQTLLL